MQTNLGITLRAERPGTAATSQKPIAHSPQPVAIFGRSAQFAPEPAMLSGRWVPGRSAIRSVFHSDVEVRKWFRVGAVCALWSG